jgi:hypothetical protein
VVIDTEMERLHRWPSKTSSAHISTRSSVFASRYPSSSISKASGKTNRHFPLAPDTSNASISQREDTWLVWSLNAALDEDRSGLTVGMSPIRHPKVVRLALTDSRRCTGFGCHASTRIDVGRSRVLG